MRDHTHDEESRVLVRLLHSDSQSPVRLDAGVELKQGLLAKFRCNTSLLRVTYKPR